MLSNNDNNNRVTAENPNLDSCLEFKLFSFVIKTPPSNHYMDDESMPDDITHDIHTPPLYDFFPQQEITDDIDLTLSLALPYYNQEEEEVVIDVVPLNVYNPAAEAVNQIDWMVTKTLSASDCNGQHRLLISKKAIQERIFPYLTDSTRFQISSTNGLRVDVLDLDTGTLCKQTLKKWPTAPYYGLMDNWKRDFSDRRRLVAGDVVGLSWDEDHNRLLFSVLQRKFR
ncbi:hypothetical protein RND81_03G119600 [Saponaria officinalis]|uniref:TF-B3 domain-containing protein n=1 Tax=Saponaria officinalis TaxID=3572 RepID=A0AAW1M6J5_SAPOF